MKNLVLFQLKHFRIILTFLTTVYSILSETDKLSLYSSLAASATGSRSLLAVPLRLPKGARGAGFKSGLGSIDSSVPVLGLASLLLALLPPPLFLPPRTLLSDLPLPFFFSIFGKLRTPARIPCVQPI